MARRVLMHIGAPKSGTTFLQTVMWENRDLLKKHGLLYPGQRRFDQFHVYDTILHGGPPNAQAREAWERIRAEIAEWSGDVLLTHEFFGGVSAERAAWGVDQLRPATVEVVFTARDFVRGFPGVWLEALKMGSPRTFEEFVAAALQHEEKGVWSWQTQDTAAILEKWGAAVGENAVHVVTVPPSGAPRDLLWHRWSEALAIDPSWARLDVALPNESLGASQAALLHRAQSALTAPLTNKPETYHWFRAYFAQQVLSSQGRRTGDEWGLGPEAAATFAAWSALAADAIAARGYQVHGDLDDLRPQPPYLGSTSPLDVAEADQLDVAVRAIDTLLHDVRRLTRERDTWRRRAKRAGSSRTALVGGLVAQARSALARVNPRRSGPAQSTGPGDRP